MSIRFARAARGCAFVGLAVLSLVASGCTAQAEPGPPPVRAPTPVYDPPAAGDGLQTAVLSGGCFWGVQGVFQHVKGVKKVLSGYAGGVKATAEYEVVSTGTTGHAESVKITFDPKQISYGELLRIYFSVATDPTQLNQQYPDTGSQYRGDIFAMDGTQKTVAERYIAQLEAAHTYRRRIVTRVDAFKGFFPAETYHQDYLLIHPDSPYIATYDLPKVAALKSLLPADYRASPVRAL
jgi:peptide-methionine (S)-S-oxide reductase